MIGFEAMRELSALGNAADELLLSPSSAPLPPALPFSLEISPDAGGNDMIVMHLTENGTTWSS